LDHRAPVCMIATKPTCRKGRGACGTRLPQSVAIVALDGRACDGTHWWFVMKNQKSEVA